MSTTLSTSRPRSRRAIILPQWTHWVGFVALVVGLLFLVTILFGRVSGEEFSPQTFKRRTFHFYEIPFLRIQVWPVKRFDATGDLETLLVKQKLVATKPPAKPRWDLVRGYQGNTLAEEGDAIILARYLDLLDNDFKQPWLEWTNDQPKLAKVFWPRVATLAEQELYLFLPDLFAAAQAAKDEADLATNLDRILAKKYHDFGLVQQRLERHQDAVQLLTEATKLAPDNAAWKRELETSRKALATEPRAEALPADAKQT